MKNKDIEFELTKQRLETRKDKWERDWLKRTVQRIWEQTSEKELRRPIYIFTCNEKSKLYEVLHCLPHWQNSRYTIRSINEDRMGWIGNTNLEIWILNDPVIKSPISRISSISTCPEHMQDAWCSTIWDLQKTNTWTVQSQNWILCLLTTLFLKEGDIEKFNRLSLNLRLGNTISSS